MRGLISPLSFDGLFLIIVSSSLFAALSVAVVEINLPALAFILLSQYFSLLIGRTLLSILRVELPSFSGLAAELVAGFAALSTVMLLFCVFLQISADVAFLVACAIGLAAAVAFGATSRPLDRTGRKTECGAALLICVLSVVWSWQAITAFPRLQASGIFPAWQDFFFHSAMITEFAHFSSLGGTWIYAYGASLPLYHYANYLFPAALSAFSGLPALALATAIIESASFIVMGLGAWVLGTVLAGRAGGVASLIAIFALPDAVCYGFANPYFDFHWLLQITPAAYAVGLSLLSVAFSITAFRRNSDAAFWLSATLTLMTALFRMQLFVLLLLSQCLLMLIAWRPRKRSLWWASLALLLLLGVAAVGGGEFVARAPHFLSMPWEPRTVLRNLLHSDSVSEQLPDAVFLPADIGILLLTAFGALLPIYVAGVFWCRRLSLRDRFDLVPFLFVAAYCLMVLAFPSNTGDEFQHRPFLLVYGVLAVWCGVLVTRLVTSALPRRGYALLIAIGLVLFPFPFYLQNTAQSGHAQWEKVAARNLVPKGLMESALYIRRHASMSDVILKSSDDGDVPNFGYLVALSERACYVLQLRSETAWKLWGVPVDLVKPRQAVSQKLLRAQSFGDLSRIAQVAGIDWYVLSPPDHLPESIVARATMSADGYFVFHLRGEPLGEDASAR